MKKFTRGRIDAFLAKYAADTNALDIGAGGDDHRALFPNRTTLDIDAARNPDVVGDAERLPFGDDSYEIVICSEVLEHIRHPEKAISEMRRVLRPGGTLVLTTRFAFPVHDAPADYWRFTPYGLRALFEEWELLEFATDGGPLYAVAVQLQRIAFQTTVRGGKLTKAFLYAIAYLLAHIDGLILTSYGDIRRSTAVPGILSSGVFIACKKI